MFFVVLFCLFLLVIFHNFYYKRRNLPSGPLPLPLVGNLLSVLWAQLWYGFPEKAFLDWCKGYGSVFTYWMGEIPVVVVADYKAISHSFDKDGDAYSERPSFVDDFHRLTRGGTFGIISNSGHVWQKHRRFAIQALKNLGMGKELFEKKILNEVSAMISAMKKDLAWGQAEHLIPNKHVDLALGSIINSILFGHSFCHKKDMKEFLRLKDIMMRFFSAYGNTLILPCLSHPHLFGHLPMFSSAISEIRLCFNQLFEKFDAEIAEHKKQRETLTSDRRNNYNGGKSVDFLHAYLSETEKHESHFFKIWSILSIAYGIGRGPGIYHNGMYIVAEYAMEEIDCNEYTYAHVVENVSTTLAWGIAHMLWNTNIQTQLHAELDQQLFSSDLITWADRRQLPFTNAVVAECQRIANLVPQNLLHSTSRDVTIEGVKITAGTTIVPQISAVLYNDKLFANPLQFNPGRFIDHMGQFSESKQFVPFSVGKRRCVGEQLARMELFLFVANLFHHFEASHILATVADKLN